jgi:eukaryotic-like serine/threonine-protein kinase
MSEPPRLRRVEEIYHEALARGPAERDAYLQAECGSDMSLLEEVKSLLGYEGEARQFLSEPAPRAVTQKVAVSRGTRLGPYEVEELIGAGGMGEVYRARDTRLGRAVAVKVLPDHVARDEDALARFSREARTIGALSHPHICALHDVGREGEVDYLVMELLEGETLAERLRRGPLRLEQVLRHAVTIADALAAAHARGIVHRDLKPGNVMLTREGTKLLDFGLAKLRPLDGWDGKSTEATGTREELVAGTPPYMAPEQLERGTADARTDIFALGAVIFEMATGERAFTADSPARLLAKVLEADAPSLAALRPGVPPALDRLVGRCLRKDPAERWQAAADVGLRLREISDQEDESDARGRRFVSRWAIPAIAVAALISLVAVAAFERWPRPRVSPIVIRSHIDFPPDVALVNHPSRTAFALSPDGTELVWAGRPNNTAEFTQWGLYARRLDSDQVRRIAGTEEAIAPIFSPDGRSLAFFTRGNTRLRKVPVEGGLAVDLAETSLPMYGAAWLPDGRILVALTDGLGWLPVEGGGLRQLTQVDRQHEDGHVLPFVLPNARAALFTVMPHAWGPRARIEGVSLTGGARKVVVDDAADARYLPSGHLVFVRRGVLMAAPFDPIQLELQAPPVPVVNGVVQALDMPSPVANTGAGQFVTSSSGLLAYVAGGPFEFPAVELVLVDTAGHAERLPGFDKPAVSAQSQFSPDGRLLAFVEQARSGLLWLFDVERKTYRRLSHDGVAGCPVWSPDGTRLVVSWSKGGLLQLWELPVEGGEWRRLVESDGFDCATDWSPDGRFLAFSRSAAPGPSREIMLYDFEERAVTPFLPMKAWSPAFSPDGRWLAYASEESGRIEAYVTSFPDRARTATVSQLGGESPFWSRDGRTLFYRTLLPSVEGRAAFMGMAGATYSLVRVEVRAGPALALGPPRTLARLPEGFIPLKPGRCVDQHPNGRFLVGRFTKPFPDTPITRLELVHNWFAELKRVSPRQR